VTHISGIETFRIEPKDVVEKMSKFFAASATTQEGLGKVLEIIIQGDISDRVGDWLIENYGIPKKYIAN